MVDLQIQTERIEQVGPRFVLVPAMRFLLYSGHQRRFSRSTYPRRFQRHVAGLRAFLLIAVSDLVSPAAREGDHWVIWYQLHEVQQTEWVVDCQSAKTALARGMPEPTRQPRCFCRYI